MAAEYPYLCAYSHYESLRQHTEGLWERSFRENVCCARTIHATCLGDEETVYWNREDFTGVLDEQYLPEWAKEKLEALRAPRQDQSAAPTIGGMEMG